MLGVHLTVSGGGGESGASSTSSSLRLTFELWAPKEGRGSSQASCLLGHPGTLLRGIRGHLSPWQLEAQPNPPSQGTWMVLSPRWKKRLSWGNAPLKLLRS